MTPGAPGGVGRSWRAAQCVRGDLAGPEAELLDAGPSSLLMGARAAAVSRRSGCGRSSARGSGEDMPGQVRLGDGPGGRRSCCRRQGNGLWGAAAATAAAAAAAAAGLGLLGEVGREQVRGGLPDAEVKSGREGLLGVSEGACDSRGPSRAYCRGEGLSDQLRWAAL